jgi:putative Holliday junction resolvase
MAMYTASMKVLGVDLGDRRIGLALSDPSGVVALGAGFLEMRSQREALDGIEAIVSEKEVDQVVIGLPLTMSGQKGERAQITERFVDRLREHVQVPIMLWDERFTSEAAKRTLSDAGRGARRAARREKGRTDEIAATLLLQSWLDSQRQEEHPVEG